MENRKDEQIVQQVFEVSLSGISDDPWMAQRVLSKARETPEKGGFIVKKKKSLAMVLLMVCFFVSASVALAAIVSNTAQCFGDLYGEGWTDAALRGDIDTSRPSVQLGDVVYTMDDVIVIGIAWEAGSLTEDDSLCTRATANGLLDDEGNLYEGDILYTGIVQEDGSLVFHMEIDLAQPIPRQESYTLSVYIANHQVTPDGNHLMDTRVSRDWVFAVHPVQIETMPATAQPEAEQTALQQPGRCRPPLLKTETMPTPSRLLTLMPRQW